MRRTSCVDIFADLRRATCTGRVRRATCTWPAARPAARRLPRALATRNLDKMPCAENNLHKAIAQAASSQTVTRQQLMETSKLRLHRSKHANSLDHPCGTLSFVWGACYHRGGRGRGLTKHVGNMLSGQASSGSFSVLPLLRSGSLPVPRGGGLCLPDAFQVARCETETCTIYALDSTPACFFNLR